MDNTVGFVGLGRLGTPVAVAMSSPLIHREPARVIGYDINERLMRKRQYEHKEAGYPCSRRPESGVDFQELFDTANLSFAPLAKLVADCKLIFVAVQTPHQPQFDGTSPLSEERDDFNYVWLEDAVQAIVKQVDLLDSDFQDVKRTIVVISTVLPGTMRKRIIRLLSARCQLVYNPYFIAMGTCVRDWLEPEFVLIGSDSPCPLVDNFYSKLLPNAKRQHVSIESAELTKVAYNLEITSKICYANTLMEMAHKIPGCNVDEVADTLALATNRLWSPRYTRGGMGDAGACHPRDMIAMSWLARELNLSHNLFDDYAMCRDNQAGWLADMAEEIATQESLSIVIMGKAFKPESNLVDGSCALLLRTMLLARGLKPLCYDPVIDGEWTAYAGKPAVYVIACKHACFASWRFPAGSVVIDPHRYVAEQDGVRVIQVGVGK